MLLLRTSTLSTPLPPRLLLRALLLLRTLLLRRSFLLLLPSALQQRTRSLGLLQQLLRTPAEPAGRLRDQQQLLQQQTLQQQTMQQ